MIAGLDLGKDGNRNRAAADDGSSGNLDGIDDFRDKYTNCLRGFTLLYESTPACISCCKELGGSFFVFQVHLFPLLLLSKYFNLKIPLLFLFRRSLKIKSWGTILNPNWP